MFQILLEQRPDFGYQFLLQPHPVEHLIALEGLPGVQGQQFQDRVCPEQVGEGSHPQPHPVRGEDGEVVRADQIEDPLPAGGNDTVVCDAADPHKGAGGLLLPEGFLPFECQGSNLQTKNCWRSRRKQAARWRKPRMLDPSTWMETKA